jgi:hypothetical protein
MHANAQSRLIRPWVTCKPGELGRSASREQNQRAAETPGRHVLAQIQRPVSLCPTANVLPWANLELRTRRDTMPWNWRRLALSGAKSGAPGDGEFRLVVLQ